MVARKLPTDSLTITGRFSSNPHLLSWLCAFMEALTTLLAYTDNRTGRSIDVTIEANAIPATAFKKLTKEAGDRDREEDECEVLLNPVPILHVHLQSGTTRH